MYDRRVLNNKIQKIKVSPVSVTVCECFLAVQETYLVLNIV